MLRVNLLLILILSAAASFAAELPLEDWPPPANPREFHDQEWQRIVRDHESFGEPPIAETQQDYDALYYHLTVDVRAFAARVIYGNVQMIGRSLVADFNELVLDLCSTLIVDSVIVGGAPRSFTRNGHLLTIATGNMYDAGESFDSRIYYHGTPCNTNLYPSFSYFNRSMGSYAVPTIYTLSEPYGARDWWPSKNLPEDKADSARISIIVADTLTATSNGVLESLTPVNPSARNFTWFEKHPIATYLISLNATNYTSFTNWYTALDGDSMPIIHYPFPERLANAQISWNALPAMMDFCADMFGEYPFVDEKYGHTMFIINGGMEHQCNTSYGRGITNGQHTYDYIVQHELAHQYFGDCVTLETWPDIWLNEGFASYAEALWFEHVSGFAAYRNYMLSPTNNGVTDPSGPVYNPLDLFSSNTVYNKGAWILHMLRGAVRNDSLFFAMLRTYKQNHLYATANTEQFLSDVSSSAGIDVTPYLYPYLYLTNRPHYLVSFGTGAVDGVLRTVTRIRQVHSDPDTTFQTRLDLAFDGAVDTTVSVINSQWQERYYFSFGAAPDSLQVDPDDWVLKELAMEPLPVTVLNTSLNDALATLPYGDTLVAIGGQSPYTWSIISGALPSGITLTGEGRLTGSTAQIGTFAFTAQVEGTAAGTDTVALVLRVVSPLTDPQGLTVYRTGSTYVNLRWEAVPYATGYRVYRATQADLSDAELIAITSINKIDDPILPPGDPEEAPILRYYYVVAVLDWP